MFVRLLGVMDTLSASLLFLHTLIPIYWKILLLFGMYHVTKAFIFRGNMHSFFDGLAGITILGSMLLILPWVNILLGLYLLQKGLLSLHAG